MTRSHLAAHGCLTNLFLQVDARNVPQHISWFSEEDAAQGGALSMHVVETCKKKIKECCGVGSR